MSAARDELTGDERAELHRLRRIVKQLRSLLGAAPVDDQPDPKVRRQATDEDFAEIQRIRRRKGLSRG